MNIIINFIDMSKFKIQTAFKKVKRKITFSPETIIEFIIRDSADAFIDPL